VALLREGDRLRAVLLRRDDHQLGNTGGRGQSVAFHGGPAVAQQDRNLATRRVTVQLLARGAQSAGQIGGAVPAQRQQIGDDHLARLVAVLTLHRDDLLAEGQDAVTPGATGGNRRGRDGCSGQRLAAH